MINLFQRLLALKFDTPRNMVHIICPIWTPDELGLTVKEKVLQNILGPKEKSSLTSI